MVHPPDQNKPTGWSGWARPVCPDVPSTETSVSSFYIVKMPLLCLGRLELRLKETWPFRIPTLLHLWEGRAGQAAFPEGWWQCFPALAFPTHPCSPRETFKSILVKNILLGYLNWDLQMGGSYYVNASFIQCLHIMLNERVIRKEITPSPSLTRTYWPLDVFLLPPMTTE